MRKGLVKITPELIRESLKFPDSWEIESMNTIVENGTPIIEAIISGIDFPKEPRIKGIPAKQCRIIYHKESFRVEVKEVI